MRVVFLTNIISPYRKPVFERLAATPGWDFHVVVNAAGEFDRSWDVATDGLNVTSTRTFSVPRTVVSTEPIRFEQVITLHLPLRLGRDLARLRPDVIISHELGPRTIQAARYARRHRVPLIIWAYQSRVSATQGRRAALRRHLLRRADAVVGMGTQAREVLRRLGVDEARIIDAPNACDHPTLTDRCADPAAIASAATWRAQYGEGRRIALVVGRMVPLKGTVAILDAWRALPAAVRDDWRLVFAGEGPLRPFVQAAFDEGVRDAGCVQPDGMAACYLASDLHVFPSLGDVWGLVVNEAMTCGVPNLCSIHAGCCDDLIVPGDTGLEFDPTDPGLAAAELEAALTAADLTGMGRRGQEHVASFTLDGLADGFRRAVHAAGKHEAQRSRRAA